MGALATGSAAAIGTGATDGIRADRNLSVELAEDANAALGLEATDSSYTQNSMLNIDFSGGVNNNGTTSARPGFTIENNFDKPLYVEIWNEAANSDITDGGVDVQFVATDDANAQLFPDETVLFDRDETVQQITDQPGTSRDPATIPNTGQGNINDSWGGQTGFTGTSKGKSETNDPQYLRLEVGASVDVIVRIVANDASSYDTVFDGTVEIRAFENESETYISNGPAADVGSGPKSE